MIEIHWSVWISLLIAIIVTVLTRHVRARASDKEYQALPGDLRIGYAIELGFRLVTVGTATWFVLYLIRAWISWS